MTSYPMWMMLYFGTFGTAALLLIALIFWTWMKTTRLAQGYIRTALFWKMVGYAFLFCANWFA